MSRVARTYVASEGWLFIAAMIASGFVAKFYFGLLGALPLWLLAMFVAYLFRDPAREIPAAPLGVVSPADAEVLVIDSVYDEYLKRNAIRVTMRMNRLGSYVTRAPIEGKIVQRWQTAANSEGDTKNMALDRYAMQIQTDENDDVVLVMGGAYQALKPVFYHQSGERIGQGERCGLIRFGGYLELLLPDNSRVQASEGDHVLAGSDILASLIRGNATETTINMEVKK